MSADSCLCTVCVFISASFNIFELVYHLGNKQGVKYIAPSCIHCLGDVLCMDHLCYWSKCTSFTATSSKSQPYYIIFLLRVSHHSSANKLTFIATPQGWVRFVKWTGNCERTRTSLRSEHPVGYSCCGYYPTADFKNVTPFSIHV